MTPGAVKGFIEAMGIKPKVISYRCPWQNGVCERMIGTLRRDLLNHVTNRQDWRLGRNVRVADIAARRARTQDESASPWVEQGQP